MMVNNRKRNLRISKSRRTATCAVLLSLLMLSGCGEKDMDALVPPKDVTYTGVEQDTAVVEKGDISPVFEKVINLAGAEETTYRIEKNKYDDMVAMYKAEFGKLHVAVGDYVHAGDTLVSFTSERLNKELKENQDNKAQAVLQKEHYQNLMQLDSSLDYSYEISNLDEQIKVADMYISDVNSTYSSINIIAEGDGVVSFVDPSLEDGFMSVGVPLIRVSVDAGYYEMDLTEDGDTASSGDALTTTDVEFHVGDRFKAKTYLSEYEVEVIGDPTQTNEEGEESTPTDAIISGKVYFKLLGDETLKENTLMLTAEMPEIKNALYVDKKAIIENEGRNYVYKDVDGEYIATEVTVGANIGQYVIIKEGLEEGDVVSLSD